MDKEYPINEAGELTVDIGTPDEAKESEKKERDKGLNLTLPDTELQLSDGSISSEIQFNAGANNDVTADKEILDMDKLSLTNPTKYLATYKNPHDWILDEREAEAMQILRKVAEPEQASKVGTLAYSAGEFLRKTANVGRDFGEYAEGIDAYILPNANKEAAQRAYNNMKKLSVQAEQNRAEYVSQHGVDPDVYGIGTNVMEVARDIALTGGVAAFARRGATKAAYGIATRRLAPSATEVAERWAAQQGKKAASRAARGTIAGTTFVREAGDRSTQQVAQYIDATGDYDLKYYDPTLDLALNTGVSAINATIEMSLGIERVVPDMLFGKRGVGRVATEFIQGYIGERSEEFLQNLFDQGGNILSGYRKNLSVLEAWNDSAAAGWIGGVFGSGTAAGMYYLNRRRMIRQLEDSGIDKGLATEFVDKVLQEGVNKTLNNMSATVELRSKNGQAYEKLKAGIKSALELQGWNEKMIDQTTGKVMNIDQYVETVINSDMINTAIREATKSGITIDEWLDIAKFKTIDNVMYLQPLGTDAEIQERIAAQDAIIQRQTELKKTGAGDEGVLQDARMRKAILQKARVNKLLDNEIQKASIREATTPEVQREIDTATTDAESLGYSANAEGFSAELDSKTENGLPLTSEQKAKRLGNAVIKRIFGRDKAGFNAVMALPEYANARNAIINSADKIFDYAKKHRTYSVYKDLREALKMMQTVNAGNFIEAISTPDFSGEDQIGRNAFLYNFLFNEPGAISSFIDAYLIRAEESVSGYTKTSLSKKDIVGQTFKALDDLMQTQAAAAGTTYTSIYNEDGSVADKNIGAIFTSYQNQFVSDKGSALNQIAYASMKGDLWGDYLDANLFAGTGEGAMVWGWGNYLLKSLELDKKYYFDRFETVGPELRYDGKKITYKTFDDLGIWTREARELILNRLGDLSLTKDWLIKTLSSYLKKNEDAYNDRVKRGIQARTMLGEYTEEEVRDIVKDIEAITLTDAGARLGAIANFTKATEEYITDVDKAREIQSKYRNEDGTLSEAFVDIYKALVDEFGGFDNLTTKYLNIFARTLNQLQEERETLENAKKLDFDKFSGRTGLLYKGKPIDVMLEKLAGFYNFVVRDEIARAIKTALAKGQNVVEELNKLGPKIEWDEDKIKEDAYEIIDKEVQDEYLAKRLKKTIDDLLGDDSIGASVFSIADKNSITEGERPILDDIINQLKPEKYSLGGSANVIQEVFWAVRGAKAKQKTYDAAKKFFKNAKNSDFLYKPSASLYSFEIPEDEEFLWNSRSLNKQSTKVQDAIRRLVAENIEDIPDLREVIYVNSSHPYMELNELFGIVWQNGWDRGYINDFADKKMQSNRYKNGFDVGQKLSLIVNRALDLVGTKYNLNKKATVADFKQAIDDVVSDMLYGPSASEELQLESKDFRAMQEFLETMLDKKHSDDEIMEDLASSIKSVELDDMTGEHLYKVIKEAFVFNNERAEKYRNDPTLNASEHASAAELTSKLLLKYGIQGIKYFGHRDKTGFVTFAPTKAKERLYSLDWLNKRNKLVVTHGISLDKLEKALKLGGLPSPSLAISRADAPLEDFGGIKLVGSKDMIDPTDPRNAVFDRDVWSQRFPEPVFKNASIKKRNEFRDKFRDAFVRADDESSLFEILHVAVNSNRPGQVIDRFRGSTGAELYYVENVLGKKIDVPMRDKYNMSGLSYLEPDQKFLDEVSKIHDSTEPYDVWGPQFKKAVNELIDRGGIKEEWKVAPKDPAATVEHIKRFYNDVLKEFQVGAMIGQVKDYVFRNEKVVDRQVLFAQLLKYDLQNSAAYESWAAKQTEELLGDPIVQVGNKRLPWNLKNITRAMLQGNIIGSENTGGVTVGKVIASGAKRFKSVEEIREGGRQLKTPEIANSITDKAGNKVTRFAELVLDFVGEDNRETVYNALTIMTALENPTTADIKRILEEELAQEVKLDEKLLKLGVDMVKEVKRVVRSYFEAKPQRIVDFDEFIGAIIPEHMVFDDVADQLRAKGLLIARTQDVKEGLAELVAQNDEIVFQGGRAKINGQFDPELNTILLGKNFNTMTLPHELAHYWLEKIFTVYKRVQAGELQANPEWIAEKKEMFDMLGISENQLALTKTQQEKFATMVEAYLTGIGVTKEVPQTFKEYFKWVPEKYRSVQQLSYLDEQGKMQNVFLDAKAVEFFNRWYENISLPSLSTSPERQRFMNVTGDDGEVIRVSIKEMNDREKEFAQDAEEQIHTDERLYNTLDENMPADIKPTADAQKVVMAERGNFLKNAEEEQKRFTEEPKRRWFERKTRETEEQKAMEYITKNPEHAHEIVFGDPELIPNDTGVDRATLINAYMAMNNITPDKPEWATLHTNIAINQSLAGTQLALSNDKSYATYLDALREVEEALELKAATNYAGSKVGARERFNADIQRFLDRELPAIFATEPDSKEREMALRTMFEKARTTFSGNTTGSFLNQVDIDYAKAQRTKTDAFVRWAMNQIKKDAGAKLNSDQQAKLLQISAKAQQALVDLDDRNAAKAVAAAQELRKWQLEKQKMMGVNPQKWTLFGDWAPRAMLASFNTLVVANVPSTAINTTVVNLVKRGTKGGIFGENNVSKELTDAEVKRIKAIYGATSMNLAQMEKPTSPSLLHGEKYSASGQKWYDPYTILGREDNFFRVPTFVDTLARIASTDAKATGRSADEVFKEYLKLDNQTDAAKLARKQALAVANMAVFTQNGALASCLNHIRSELNKLSRVMIGLEPQGFGLGNLIAPFLTTGANIAEMGIRGSIAPITTITSLVQSWRTGKAIDPMKKLALRMDWTYFVISSVSMALLAALTSDDDDFYMEPYRTGMKYDPNKPYDSINIDGVWLDLDFFGPFAIPIRTAAKVIQAWKEDNGVGSAVAKGYAASSKTVLGDIPLAESIINNQFNWATRKPGSFLSSYLYTQANKLVPSQIKPISRALSRGQDWEFEGDWMGPTIKRKFHRNYGFDGEELTTQDLIDMFTIKIQLDNSLNKEI